MRIKEVIKEKDLTSTYQKNKVMAKKETLQLFENKKVRSVWDAEAEKWYISIIDVVEVLTESNNPQVSWRVFKNDLRKRVMKPLQIVTV